MHGRDAHDNDLDAALVELMDDREALTRRLVGGDAPPVAWSLPEFPPEFDEPFGPEDAD